MNKAILLLLLSFVCHRTMSQHKNCKVYVFVAEKCPISIFMTTTLKEVSEAFGQQADFYLVFPMENSTQKSAAKFKAAYKLDSFQIVMDNQLRLTQSFGATITPEAVITNSLGAVIYKGRINDAYLEPGKRRHYFTGNDLSDALSLLANNQPVPKPWKPAVGCLITLD